MYSMLWRETEETDCIYNNMQLLWRKKRPILYIPVFFEFQASNHSILDILFLLCILCNAIFGFFVSCRKIL